MSDGRGANNQHARRALCCVSFLVAWTAKFRTTERTRSKQGARINFTDHTHNDDAITHERSSKLQAMIRAYSAGPASHRRGGKVTLRNTHADKGVAAQRAKGYCCCRPHAPTGPVYTPPIRTLPSCSQNSNDVVGAVRTCTATSCIKSLCPREVC